MLQIQEFNAALFTFKCCKVNVVKKLSRLFSYFFPFFDQKSGELERHSLEAELIFKQKTITLWPTFYTVSWNIIPQVIQRLNYMLTTCCRDIGVFPGYLCAGTRITSTYTATIKTSFTVHSVITANNLQMFEVRLSAWVRIV